jgi:hypothetical protein
MRFTFLCSIGLAVAGTAACSSCSPDRVARGSASVSWSITALGGPSTCARAGGASVSLLLRSRGSGDEAHFTFRCTDTRGTTQPITAGPYDATLTLYDADGATLAVGPTQRAVAIDADRVTTLTPVIFTVEGGKLVLSFATLATTTNCLLREQGGAGITASTITLERAAGGCAPVTFIRSRGETTIGTYTVNCSSPQVAPCIERDETLTVDGLESGPYVIRASGLLGAIQCWAAADVLTVPAGASLVKSIQLAPSRGPGC